MNDVHITVSRIRGGFIFHHNNGEQEIVTSLNKAMKLVRDALTADSEPVDPTELAE